MKHTIHLPVIKSMILRALAVAREEVHATSQPVRLVQIVQPKTRKATMHNINALREKQILVYADWEPGAAPFTLGTLTPHSAKGQAREVDLAMSVAPVFRVGADEATAIVERVRSIVSRWRPLAEKVGIPRAEQDRMASAFALATP